MDAEEANATTDAEERIMIISSLLLYKRDRMSLIGVEDQGLGGARTRMCNGWLVH
jgi:hypothetical protein